MTRFGIATGVAGLVLLGACGGGGGKAPLSAAYVKHANSLCGEWTQALKDLGPPPPLGDVTGTARFTTKLLAIDNGFTDRFKALDATSEEKGVLGPIYAGFDAINAAEASTLTAAQKGDRSGMQTNRQAGVDETTKLNVKLKALELKLCSG